MESVRAAGDEANLVVERFGAVLVDAEADRVEDPVAVFADRLGEAHERGRPAAERAADEPLDQDRDVLERQAGGEDRPQRFLGRVGASYLAAGGFGSSERLGLLVVEVVGGLERRPARVLEPSGGVAVAEAAQLVSVASADFV